MSVLATFKRGSNFAVAAGLWQHSYGQKLIIQGLELPVAIEVHFSFDANNGDSETEIGITKDGITTVAIPEQFLENDITGTTYEIYAFIYMSNIEEGETIKRVTMPVKCRPKIHIPIETENDRKLFREAIVSVNKSSEDAINAATSSEAWSHGHADYPEMDKDNAKYYAGQARNDASQTQNDRNAVSELSEHVDTVAMQVDADNAEAGQYMKQTTASAANALRSEQAAKTSETAAQEAMSGAEAAEWQAELFANQAAEDKSAVEAAKTLIMQMGQEVSDNKASVEQTVSEFELEHQQAVADVNNAGQAQAERVDGTGDQVVKDINAAGATQINAINSAGEQQVKAVEDAGSVQISTVQEAAAEIIADREKINQNEINIRNLKDYIIDAHKATTWSEIAKAVQTGLADDMFAIGDEFTNTWTDTVASKSYDNPLRVNHFEDVELEDGTIIHGMWLQTHYAQLKGVQFSHQRAFLSCPYGLPAGTYYFTIETKWGNNVVAGDIVCFTTTIDVPAGGKVSGCYGAPDQAKENWRVYTHSADGKSILETITPTFEASGTDLGTQKHNTRNGNLNSTQEMAYGWNRWKTSALRQYLNSDKPKGDWWESQDEWDIAPDQLSQIDGYLCGMNPELLAVIQPVKTVTYTNTVNDGGGADVTYDRVILPSLEQMYVNPQIAGEGEAHEYYKELNGTKTKYAQYSTYEELKTYAVENHASSQHVRLRSANCGSASNTWYGNSNGYVSGSSAPNAYRFAPLVLIGINPNEEVQE